MAHGQILTSFVLRRDDIREQHIIGKEISDAIAQSIGTETLDETELEEEFEQLQQEELDAQMTHAGPAPADKINQLPTAPETSMSRASLVGKCSLANCSRSQRQDTSGTDGRRRRRRGVTEAAS